MSRADVTIAETGDGWLEVAEVGHEGAALRPAEVAALRAYFAAERMPEEVQRPTEEGGVWGSYVPYLAALEAAYSQRGAEPEWEYARKAPGDDEPWSDVSEDLDSLMDGNGFIGDVFVRRRKAGPWEPVERGADRG